MMDNPLLAVPPMSRLDRRMLRAPFPWFGGKTRAAPLVWDRIGDVPNLVIPFFGSGSELWLRPHWPFDPAGPIHSETVNDLDGCVTNAWRAIQHDPEQTAVYADNPVHELDLHARHLWLHRRLTSKEGLDTDTLSYAASKGVMPFAAWLTTDPEAYDCRVAGWWIWGLSSWIGDNWCRPGPQRGQPHLGGAGKGVNRQLPHLGDAGIGDDEGSCARHRRALVEWFAMLADRLRFVDVCCGDWSRVCGFTPTVKRASPCGVILDPPYSQEVGLDTVYGDLHDPKLSAKVREWAIERGRSPAMRIAYCGYDEEVAPLVRHGWTMVKWKAHGGYASQSSRGNQNRFRECITFSPHCLTAEPDSLFECDR